MTFANDMLDRLRRDAKCGPRYIGFEPEAIRVHRDVTAGAISRDGGFLTDHGPEHIETVLSRAAGLIRTKPDLLSMYETLLLVFAIHLHDIGNIHGRQGHQLTAKRVADWFGAQLGRDQLELRWILRIAAAHTGGKGSQDTIQRLEIVTAINGSTIRPRLLAAILRLADELADDRSRASRYLLDTNALPPESEVYHHYAYALHTVQIDHEARSIHLHFDIDKATASKQIGKGAGTVYLLDEIFDRTFKMHCERIYTMRFLQEHVQLERIRVTIHVYDDQSLEPIEVIGYILQEAGYPTTSPAGIYAIAPDLASYSAWNQQKVTGASLAARLGNGSSA